MTLARFTPSILDAETLERLFVHRHDLLDDVLHRARGAADGSERRHRLFVGPRGAGKTHLISLVNHRVQQAMDDGLRVQLSWLIEDPWEIESYDDLLDQILEHLGAPERDSKVSAESAILAAAKDRPIITLVENLDQILDAIDDDGQRRLRALLENERPLLIIATSTRLSDDLLSQAQPFYGFFDTTQLAPFDVDQAADMLAAVADYNENPSLGELLHSPTGKARLATIAHLAGGQPRVWALLGTGLTTSGIDDMIEMLLARFDDLTPYYQEQLARLAPNERKLVRRLADADRPLTVRDLAELAKLDQKSVAKTVSDLRRRGWVRKYESLLTEKLDRRLQYYELAEPLARIAFQMKASRGQPIRLILDFLASWFAAEELTESSAAPAAASYRIAAAQHRVTTMHLIRSLAGASGPSDSDNPELVELLAALDDALYEYSFGRTELLLQQPRAISRVIEYRLGGETSHALRLVLGRLAIRSGGETRWRRRIDQIMAHATDEDRPEATLLAIEIAARTGATPAVVAGLLADLRRWLELTGQSASFARAGATALPFLVMLSPRLTLNVAQLVDRRLLSDLDVVNLIYHVGIAEVFLGNSDDALAVFQFDTGVVMARRPDDPGFTIVVRHAFALLHAHAGDITSARAILAELREADVEPAAEFAAVLEMAEEVVASFDSVRTPHPAGRSSDADRMPDGLGLDERGEPR